MKVQGDFFTAPTQHRQNNSDNQSKKGDKDQELIQSSTTPDPGYIRGYPGKGIMEGDCTCNPKDWNNMSIK